MSGPTRSFGHGVLIAVGVGVALLLLQYTFLMPTSDARIKVYGLLAAAPWSVGIFLYALLVAGGLVGLALSGWRSQWACVGALVGAALAFGLLYSGLFGYLVWRYDEDVTRTGQLGRALAALAFAAAILAWARRRRPGAVTASGSPG